MLPCPGQKSKKVVIGLPHHGNNKLIVGISHYIFPNNYVIDTLLAIKSYEWIWAQLKIKFISMDEE